MAQKKKKYYVVWTGDHPGIYTSWNECKKVVLGTSAKYKSFENKALADRALEMGYKKYYSSHPPENKAQTTVDYYQEIELPCVVVDAACSGVPGPMEYRGVAIPGLKQLFHEGIFPDANNNVGEFLAIVHALAGMQKQNDTRTIYSDSRTALSWVRKKKHNSKLAKTAKNTRIFDLLHRAEKWLETHEVKNRILKWDTKRWGEIPADFGRK